MRVYFNEYNLPMEDTIYLPLASGMLRAYAEKFKCITDKYEFQPFIFKRDSVDALVDLHESPVIICFSLSMWNYNLSMEVATQLKMKYPLCQIVFGGASVPIKHQFPIDYIIKGEGEHQFAEFLAGVPLSKPESMDEYPSPYTTGIFDYIVADKSMKYQAIVETSRGCPFSCAYCYWGNGVSKKMRFFSSSYIANVARWIAKNNIEYVFCADSNFGMFSQDIETARIFAVAKTLYGFPEKFRVCYGKGTKESIFDTAMILHKAGLDKSVTLSKQSTCKEALENINRSNIKAEDFDFLQKKYSDAGISTYTEFILGLPGETLKSFKEGIESSIRDGNNLFIYHCTILPNTEMAVPEYQKRHGIRTVKIPISEIHCAIRPKELTQEYEEIIIETATMPESDWIDCAIWSWVVQLRHSLKYEGHVPESIMRYFKSIAVGITNGKNRCQVLPKYGNIYWEPEEAAFLLLEGHSAKDKKAFSRDRILYGRKS